MYVFPRILRGSSTSSSSLPRSLTRLAGCGLTALLAATVSLFLSGCGSITVAGNSALASTGANTGSSGSSSGNGSTTDPGASSGSSGSGSGGSNSGSGGSGSNSGSGSSGSGTGSDSGNGSNSGSGSTGSGSGGSSSGSGSTGSGTGSSGSNSGSGSTSGGGTSGSGSDNGAAPAGTTLLNLQTASGNWQSFSQIAPDYVDCASNCPDATWKQVFGITNPALSGNATLFELDPKAPYADVLYTSGVLGANSPQQPDSNHTLLPTLHHFTYTTDFYVGDSSVTQALEFDVSLWMSSITGMTFGTECNHLGGGDWDVWNNQAGRWTDAKVPCAFVDGWNHLTIQLEREPNNYTLYQSITLNGTTYPVNLDFPPVTAPDGWWGVNLNFQIDSNYAGAQVTTYLDNLSLTYQ